MVVSRAARYALFFLFLIPGFGLASWATRTPALRDSLGASTQQMGMILFGFSSGAMCGVLSAGWLTGRIGAKKVACAGLLALQLGLGLLALSPLAGSPVLAFCGLFAFGVGIGWAEISVNIEAAAVERAGKQQIMTTLHGFFSLGTLAGASLGMGMTALQAPLQVHLGIAVLSSIVVTFIAIRQMPQLSRASEGDAADPVGVRASVWRQLRDPSLLVICYIVLAMALAEGTATDWLPLLMIDGYGFDATLGTQIYVGFTLAMTITRFAGGAFVESVGKVKALYASAILAALGLALIVVSPWPWLAAVAVLTWGVGASLGFPLAISAAADTGGNPAQRVSIAATGGYVGFLVGPPMLGFLGEHYGLRLAMVPVMLAVALAFVATVLFSRYRVRAVQCATGAERLSASVH